MTRKPSRPISQFGTNVPPSQSREAPVRQKCDCDSIADWNEAHNTRDLKQIDLSRSKPYTIPTSTFKRIVDSILLDPWLSGNISLQVDLSVSVEMTKLSRLQSHESNNPHNRVKETDNAKKKCLPNRPPFAATCLSIFISNMTRSVVPATSMSRPDIYTSRHVLRPENGCVLFGRVI